MMNGAWPDACYLSGAKEYITIDEFFFLDSSIMEMAKCLDT